MTMPTIRRAPVRCSCRWPLLLMLSLPATAYAASGVVVAGLGGTPDHAESFETAARTTAEALRSLDPSADAIELLPAGSGRDDVLAAIEEQANEASDTFTLVLIGHGSADARGWKFNLPGPDLSEDDLVAALAVVPAERQLVVVATSASGAVLDTLTQPGRVVVTATKSGGEINAVRFPSYLADAMKSDVADLDRNEILTIAEAFRYADARTREHYEAEKLLASEHARLRGDEATSLAVARLGSLRQAGDDPVVAELLATRLEFERQYRELLTLKGERDADTFYAELETLMISIARLQASIDEASGWSHDGA